MGTFFLHARHGCGRRWSRRPAGVLRIRSHWPHHHQHGGPDPMVLGLILRWYAIRIWRSPVFEPNFTVHFSLQKTLLPQVHILALSPKISPKTSGCEHVTLLVRYFRCKYGRSASLLCVVGVRLTCTWLFTGYLHLSSQCLVRMTRPQTAGAGISKVQKRGFRSCLGVEICVQCPQRITTWRPPIGYAMKETWGVLKYRAAVWRTYSRQQCTVGWRGSVPEEVFVFFCGLFLHQLELAVICHIFERIPPHLRILDEGPIYLPH